MADNNGKIYITISDTRKGGSGGFASPLMNGANDDGFFDSMSAPTSDSGLNIKGMIEYKAIESMVNQTAKIVNYSISNIGNFTGDYTHQRDVQNVLSAIKDVSGIGVGIYAGAKIGGAYGTLIGGGIALGNLIVDKGLQTISNAYAVYKQNYEITQLRQISGLSVLTNGSR